MWPKKIYLTRFLWILSTSLLGASRSYFFPSPSPLPFLLTHHEIYLYFTLVTQSILKFKIIFLLSLSLGASRSYFFPSPSNSPWNFIIFYINYTKYIEMISKFSLSLSCLFSSLEYTLRCSTYIIFDLCVIVDRATLCHKMSS